MENLIIEGTPKTPEVKFLSSNGTLELRGRSIPENSVEFYQPLNEWIDDYSGSPQEKTVIDIKLEYFNTSSSKCILDIFKKLEALRGTQVAVNWYFEEDDEDMEEAGQDYQAIINLPFNMVAVEEI